MAWIMEGQQLCILLKSQADRILARDRSDKYVSFPGREQLTGHDLYGARCAMLHTFGPQSAMSRAGQCREILWADQCIPPIMGHPNTPGHVIVSILALRDAFFAGMDRFLIDVYKDPQSTEAKLANERFNKTVYLMSVDEVRNS